MEEIWKDIKDYEGCYRVSNLGRIKCLAKLVPHPRGGYSMRKERILKPSPNPGGYLIATLQKDKKIKGMTVHRLVALHFLPNNEGKPEVNHINGDKKDCRLENLQWVTASENQIHSSLIGLRQNKVGICNVSIIRELRKKGLSYASLSKMFHINDSSIRKIISNRTYKHI